MSVNEISNDQALQRLRAWNDVKTTLLLEFSGPYKGFQIQVEVFGILEDNSGVAFRWHLNQGDAEGEFVDTDGLFRISLVGASFSEDYQPDRLIISRGDFRCALTVL